MIVVKIAGCNGSGKTTLVRALLEDQRYRFKPVYTKAKFQRIEAYAAGNVELVADKGFRQIYILGKYETACGGMDTINNQVEKMALLRKYCEPGNLVIFEGVLTGVTYGEMGALSESKGHAGKWLYAFMDTPFRTCVERVLARREARRVAKGREPNQVDLFDPDKSMGGKIAACESVKRKALAFGHAVHDVDHSVAPKVAARDLMKAVLKLAKRQAK